MSMTNKDQLLLSFYGDDFTGAADALEFLTRAGAYTVLFLKPPQPEQLARYPGLQAVGVAGSTRSMTPEVMEAELRPALCTLRTLGAPHVHYKVCSTFDSSPAIGSIGRVIDIAARIFDARFVPLLVGAPALGRYCVFGHLFARAAIGGDATVFRLDRHPSMSKHPITPADESDLRLHLGRQTKKQIGLFDILKLPLLKAEARAELEGILASGPEVVLFDALYPEQLQRIGGLIDAYASPEQPLFSVGSSGVEMALSAHWTGQGRLKPVQSRRGLSPAGPLLVGSGTCSPVTETQIEWVLSQGFAEVALDTAALAAGRGTEAVVRQAAESAGTWLKAGRNVIVHTSKGCGDARIAATERAFARRGLDGATAKTLTAELFGSALGQVIRSAVERTGVKRVVVAGGDTSGYVARALGIEVLEAISSVAPGIPLCRARAPGSPADGLEINFKAGQAGSADYFGIFVAQQR
jgi:3-oxoisoapionate kinase